MPDPTRAPRRGPKGFFFWLAYYYKLGRTSRHGAPPFFWALSQTISNRFTYGDFAPGTEDRGA